MTREEISRYLAVGSTKSVCVDRCHMARYPGVVREVVIGRRDVNLYSVKIEFNDYGYNEGGLTYVATYSSLDEILSSLEDYLESDIRDWENFTATGAYPEPLLTAFDREESGELLLSDARSGAIHLPLKGVFSIPSGYWKTAIQSLKT